MADKANECLARFLSLSVLPFTEALAALPTDQGVYAIFAKDGRCLHAGKSITAGVRGRVRSHLYGGGIGAGGDLVQKVQDNGLATSRLDAQAWIRTNCFVKGLAVDDEGTRRWVEYLLLGTLQPIWGH
jgi:hypothetical protein